MAAIAAPPFVSYSSLTEAEIPAAQWPIVYPSLQALKGHVQEYPGCQSFDVFVRAEGAGDVLVHCYTTWDAPAPARGLSREGLHLRAAARGHAAAVSKRRRSLVMEKVF